MTDDCRPGTCTYCESSAQALKLLGDAHQALWRLLAQQTAPQAPRAYVEPERLVAQIHHFAAGMHDGVREAQHGTRDELAHALMSILGAAITAGWTPEDTPLYAPEQPWWHAVANRIAPVEQAIDADE